MGELTAVVSRAPISNMEDPMRSVREVRAAAILVAVVAMALPLAAQSGSPKTPEQRKAAYEAHKGDFDYLLGDWEFTGTNRQYGKLRGYWSAARVGEGGQLLDEYRIVGDDAETYYVTYTVRSYNSSLDRWELVGLDTGSGLQNF